MSKYYMELTNPVHGGDGWDFGEVLWSPKTGSWNIMEQIQPGDIIIHSLKKNAPHRLEGISVVKKRAVITKNKPPIPGRWDNYDEYYKIELQEYSPFPQKLLLTDFFAKYGKSLIGLGDQHSFYSLSADKKRINGTAQKYMALLPEKVKDLLFDWIKKNGIKPFEEVSVDNEDDNQIVRPGNVNPGKVKTTVERIIRDTELSKSVKTKYNNKCQICGKTIMLPGKKPYSEGHHLKKLGGLHQGPDVAGNIIVLCPYHHTEFDYGAIGIDPINMCIKHIDKSNPYHSKALAYQRKDLDIEYIKYHDKYIFNNGK